MERFFNERACDDVGDEADGRRLGRRKVICGKDEWKRRDERRIREKRTRGEERMGEERRGILPLRTETPLSVCLPCSADALNEGLRSFL